MPDETLHGNGAVQTHVHETWAPVVIDERTNEDWGKLPSSEPQQPCSPPPQPSNPGDDAAKGRSA